MINHRSRYQVGLTLNDVYPNIEGFCACGCGEKLTARQRKWSSGKCRDLAFLNFSVVKGDTVIIRHMLYSTDQGACRNCGEITDNWQADHILPVCKGGGGSSLDNFQTLCLACHQEKTYSLSHQSAISSQAASILFKRALYETGQQCNFSLNTSKEKQSLVFGIKPFADRKLSAYI